MLGTAHLRGRWARAEYSPGSECWGALGRAPEGEGVAHRRGCRPELDGFPHMGAPRRAGASLCPGVTAVTIGELLPSQAMLARTQAETQLQSHRCVHPCPAPGASSFRLSFIFTKSQEYVHSKASRRRPESPISTCSIATLLSWLTGTRADSHA